MGRYDKQGDDQNAIYFIVHHRHSCLAAIWLREEAAEEQRERQRCLLSEIRVARGAYGRSTVCGADPGQVMSETQEQD